MIYRFGLYRFDSATGELTREGRRVRLAPQPSRLLVCLLDRRGGLVTREELIEELWGQDTTVDYEAGLNSAIKQVRAALRDPASTPRYLETLPKRGYRFIAPLQVDEAESAEDVAGPTPLMPPRRSRRAVWLGAGLAALIGVALTGWALTGKSRGSDRIASAVPAGDSATLALASDAYFKGQFVLESDAERAAPRAAVYFRRALEVEPGYSPALVGLARTTFLQAMNADDPRPGLEEAQDLAQRALDAESDAAWAWIVSAQTRLFLDWDWAAAEQRFREAARHGEDEADIHHDFAYFLSAIGKHDEAIREIGLARKLDPLSPPINLNSAWIYFYARRYEEAIADAERALELEPDTFSAHYCLSSSYARLGRVEESLYHSGEMMRLAGAQRAMVDDVLEMEGVERGEAVRTWWTDGDNEQGPAWSVPLYVRGLIELARGDRDAALAQLAESVERPDYYAMSLAVDPRWDALREDPRFEQLLQRVGRGS